MKKVLIGFVWIPIFTGSVLAQEANTITEKVVASQPKEVSAAPTASSEKVEVVDLPPFAERYPPESITSEKRANEVIEAYEKEIKEIDAWQKKVDKPCYRDFLVNYCLGKNQNIAREKRANARNVWIVAKDFIREKRANEAQTQRLEKEKERAELVAKKDAQKPSIKGAGLVGSAPDSDIDISGMMTVNDGKRTDVDTKALVDGKRLNIVEPRIITPEQEKKNEEAYWKRQQEEQERLEKESADIEEAVTESVDGEMTAEEYEKADDNPKAKTGGESSLMSGPRVLTPEQEQKNEEAYYERLRKQEERERQVEATKQGMTAEEFEQDDDAPQTKEAAGKSSGMSGPRVLTPEQEQKNEEAYYERLRKQEEQERQIEEKRQGKTSAGMTAEEFEMDDDAPQAKQSDSKSSLTEPRVLSIEQEQKNEEAYYERLRKQEEKERQIAEKKEGRSSSGMTMDEFESDDAKAKEDKLGMPSGRTLTPEQEQKNEEAYERRQQEQQEKIQQAEEKKPTPPSTTEAEREQSREERRAAAEKKRQDNIRKREERAADYEKQVKLREEQQQKQAEQ